MTLFKQVALVLMLSMAVHVCAMETRIERNEQESASARSNVIIIDLNNSTLRESGNIPEGMLVRFSSLLDEESKMMVSEILAKRNCLSRECDDSKNELIQSTKACDDKKEKIDKIEGKVDSLEAELKELDRINADLIAEHKKNNDEMTKLYDTARSMKAEILKKLSNRSGNMISVDPNAFDLGRVPTTEDFSMLIDALRSVKEGAIDPSEKAAIDECHAIMQSYLSFTIKDEECLKKLHEAREAYMKKREIYQIFFARYEKEGLELNKMIEQRNQVFEKYKDASKKLEDFLTQQQDKYR